MHQGAPASRRSFITVGVGCIVAVLAVAYVLSKITLPLGDAIQAVATVAVAGATIAYVRLTRDLVAAQQQQLAQVKESARVTALLRAVTQAWAIYVRLAHVASKVPTLTTCDSVSRRAESDMVAYVNEVLDSASALFSEAVNLDAEGFGAVAASAQDLLRVSKGLNALARAMADAVSVDADAPTISWNDVRVAYYTNVRDPDHHPEWDPLAGGDLLREGLDSVTELITHLRERAGIAPGPAASADHAV